MSNAMFRKLEATQFYFLTFLVLWTSLFTIVCFYLITRDYKQICTEETVSPYKPHRLLANLSCGKLMEGGSASYSPISFEDPSQLAMNCKAIRRRRNFVEKTYEEEEDFPLAFVKTVYMDYTWLEMELSTHYSPNNFYCFVIDSKASEVFKTRLRSLANCIENVIVAAEEFDMSSMGRNIVIAQYHGLRLLMNTRKEWKYVFLLENHDILIKTNYELTQILRAYDGANDVHAVSVKRLARWRREQLKNYTFDELGLFRDATEKSLNNVLVNVKGYNQAVLTFDAVDYIFAKLNITTMLEKFNGDGHEEEFFTSSLNANDAIGLPGGFTTKCLKKISFQSMVRYTQWSLNGTCSYKTRHFICIMGMSDLHEVFQKSPHFTVNKVMPSVDFGAIGCWHEHLYKRQHFQRAVLTNLDDYRQLPFVEYHHLKTRANLDKFDCKSHKLKTFSLNSTKDRRFSIYTV